MNRFDSSNILGRTTISLNRLFKSETDKEVGLAEPEAYYMYVEDSDGTTDAVRRSFSTAEALFGFEGPQTPSI